MGVCVATRDVTVTARRRTLRVRSHVSHQLISLEESGLAPELHASLARDCRSPRRVTADVPLTPAP
jgi:hypothetical protein